MAKARQRQKAGGRRRWIAFFLNEGRDRPQIPFWLVLAPLLGFVFAVSCYRITSPDLWWHLKTGEWILQQRSFPHADPFSFTAAGRPWVAHEWLFGVLSFLACRAAGLSGLIAIKAAFVAAILALSAWTARTRGATAGMTALALAGAFAISRQRFDERPEVISLCIAAAFLLLYERGRNNPRALFLLPLLQLLWSNLHGGTALLGCGLAGAFLLDQAWHIRESRTNWRDVLFHKELGMHIAAAAGIIIASLLNPYGLSALTYGALRAKSPLNIVEFQSLWARLHQPPDIAVAALFVYAALLFAFFLARPRRVRPFEWILLPALLILAVSFFRFRSLFAILFAPTLAWHLSQGKWLGRLRWWIPALATALLVFRVAVAENRSYGYRFGFGVHSGMLPVEAADFVKSSGLAGRMFNEYEFGGYLIWRLEPALKVFIDGREDVYVDSGVAASYANRFSSGKIWQDLVAGYGIDFVMIKYPETPPSSPEASLERLAFPRSEWALVYFDDLAVVYARRNGKNQAVIRQKEIKAVQPLQLSAYLDKVIEDPVLLRQFQKEMEANLREHPSSFRGHFLMGIFALRRGPDHVAEAIGEFRQSCASNPEYVPAYLNLGNIYLRMGRLAEAREAFQEVLSLQDNAVAKEQLNRIESGR